MGWEQQRPVLAGLAGGKPFTTLFVDGNHENFDLLNALPERRWNGGRVHVVREHILHLMRGQVFAFGGLTWFTIGRRGLPRHPGRCPGLCRPGLRAPVLADAPAAGHVPGNGMSWWPEELPGAEGVQRGAGEFGAGGLDSGLYPDPLRPQQYCQKLDPDYGRDELTDFLETVNQRCRFDWCSSGITIGTKS